MTEKEFNRNRLNRIEEILIERKRINEDESLDILGKFVALTKLHVQFQSVKAQVYRPE